MTEQFGDDEAISKILHTDELTAAQQAVTRLAEQLADLDGADNYPQNETSAAIQTVGTASVGPGTCAVQMTKSPSRVLTDAH